MGADFGVGQAEHPPLVILATSIHNRVLGVLAAEVALPGDVLAVHRVVVTHLAHLRRRERPALVEERHVQVRLQSLRVGEARHGLEIVLGDIAAAGQCGVLKATGGVEVALDVAAQLPQV
ncbi:MAG: hypothetical protein HY694_16230 [Deltaproteobacteria bacterium]|nr:hypothetical protein [Deltaproteobacteria bacterium]